MPSKTPMSNDLIYKELKETLHIGEMYTKKSMKKILETNNHSSVSQSGLKYAMSKLKKEKVIKYMPDSKFWIRLLEDKKEEKDEDKSILPDDLFNAESLFHPKNVIKIEELLEMLRGDIDKRIAELKPASLDPELVIQGIDRVASRIVTEKLKEVTAEHYESIITATVKNVVRSEFKLNVVPTLLTSLRSHIDAEIENKIKGLLDTNRKQEREIKKYDDLFEKLKEMMDTRGGN